MKFALLLIDMNFIGQAESPQYHLPELWDRQRARNRRRPNEIDIAFHWASIPQGRDAEKQNDSTLRVIKCPDWHLAAKELMAFAVSAA
jgi:hypothetical protein